MSLLKYETNDDDGDDDRDDDEADDTALQEVVDRETDGRQQQHEQEDEKDRLTFVRGNLFVHQQPRDALTTEPERAPSGTQDQNWTLGTSVDPCSASKNSRLEKLNIPAMITVGNVWILVLYFCTLSL